MKKYIILSTATVVMFSLNFSAHAAQKSSNKPSARASAERYEPEVFDPDQQELPPNYSGLDRQKFLALFESRAKNIKKDEFETNDQFTERVMNPGDSLSPISTDALYAFQIKDLKLKYDADKQEYVVDSVYMCRKLSYSLTGEKRIQGLVTCEVGPATRNVSQYRGTNAFGVSANVKQLTGRTLVFAIRANSPFMSSSAFKPKPLPETPGESEMSERIRERLKAYRARVPDPGSREFFRWEKAFLLPLEKARTLKGLNIRALLLGQVSDARMLRAPSFIMEPTIDSPTGFFEEHPAIPFDVKQLIYYVVETGEILNSQRFETSQLESLPTQQPPAEPSTPTMRRSGIAEIPFGKN